MKIEINRVILILIISVISLNQILRADFPGLKLEKTVIKTDSILNMKEFFFADYAPVEYCLWPLNISGSGYFTDEYNRNYRIIINPIYNYYYESSNLVRKFETEVYSNYALSKAYSDYEGKAFTVNKLDFDMKIDYSQQSYFSGTDNYYQYQLNPDFAFYNTKNSDDDIFDRSIGFNSQILLGKGKIRDVTSKIRVLKLEERILELLRKKGGNFENNKKNFTEQQLKKITDIFNNMNYYTSKFDRPLKYIWKDIKNVLGKTTEGLDPFDIIYLSEIIEQYLERREEGWSFAGGLLYGYRDIEENISSKPYLVDYQEIGGLLLAGWSKNLTLDKQLSFGVEISQKRRFYDGFDTDFVTAKLEHKFIWYIWDKLADTFKINAEFEYNISDPENRFNLPVTVTNSFEYLIENNVNFFFEQTLLYSYNHEVGYRSTDYYHEANLSFCFGLKFNLDR